MGVTFPNGITFVIDKDNKRTYNTNFKAKTAKLESRLKAKFKPSSLVMVIYDSQTGFTERMAEVVVEGAISINGVDAELLKIGTPFSISKINSADAIILGSPVIYGRVTPMMKAFLESMKEQKKLNKLNLSDKVGAAFGSYAFSGGWVIRGLSEKIDALGIRIVTPAVSVVDGVARRQPIRLEKQILESCLELGKVVAEKVAIKTMV